MPLPFKLEKAPTPKTVEVGVDPHCPENVFFAFVRFSNRYSSAENPENQTFQLDEMLRFLTITKPGVAFSPCPIVAVELSPVQVTIENPALALALTLDVMLPSVLLTVDDPASQHQAA